MPSELLGFLALPNFPVLVHKRKPIYLVRHGVEAHAYNPSAQEVEKGVL